MEEGGNPVLLIYAVSIVCASKVTTIPENPAAASINLTLTVETKKLNPEQLVKCECRSV